MPQLRSKAFHLLFAFLLTSFVPAFSQPQSNSAAEIDTTAATKPFPHYWEQVFGSGRAILSLREGYRSDLREVKEITDLKYIRFHAIFHDEVGVYNEDAQGNPFYNFNYVDQIYDGLLKQGVKPFVELSFMPKKLAAFDSPHAFWYKQNVAPPKDYKRWDDLMAAFAKHLVERYGEDEIATWYFEVWNEPNIDFWTGNPKEQSYYELYDHTVAALKKVSPKMRVGGPATAQAGWVDKFIAHCAEKNTPVDFVSSHVYGNDTAKDVFGTSEVIPREEMVCRSVRKVHEQIKASAMPKLPLFWTEFNAAFDNTTEVTDSTYMGPWLANTISKCDGIVDVMAYWSFTDVFEEQGVVKKPFYGGFGMMAAGNIPKPSFNAFKVLHRLGEERIPVSSDSVIATRRKDGALVLATWNLGTVATPSPAKEVSLSLKGVKSKAKATIYRVDDKHGDVRPAYQAMGSPVSPTPAQLEQLRKAAVLGAPEVAKIVDGKLKLSLPPNGLAVVEIK